MESILYPVTQCLWKGYIHYKNRNKLLNKVGVSFNYKNERVVCQVGLS
jgi:hypothetical protein